MDLTVNDRINTLISAIDSNPNAFAEKIGVKATVVYNIIKGRRSKPSFEVLQKIFTAYRAVNVLWIMKGEGHIWQEPNLSTEIIEDKKVQLDIEIVNILSSIESQINDTVTYAQLQELITKLVQENFKQKNKIVELYEKQEQILDVFRKRLNLDI